MLHDPFGRSELPPDLRPDSVTREERVRLLYQAACALLTERRVPSAAAAYLGDGLREWLEAGGDLERVLKVKAPRGSHRTPAALARDAGAFSFEALAAAHRDEPGPRATHRDEDSQRDGRHSAVRGVRPERPMPIKTFLSSTHARRRRSGKLHNHEGTMTQDSIGHRRFLRTLQDEQDKVLRAITDAQLARAGYRVPDLDSNPYRGRTLMDLAELALDRAGISAQGMGAYQLVGAAINPAVSRAGAQGMTDFPVMLANIVNKVLLDAYEVAQEPWRKFCTIGSVKDFRTSPRYRIGSFATLDDVPPGGEFRSRPFQDAQQSDVTASTKGNIIELTREVIISDDIGAIVRMSSTVGRAAARTVEADVFGLLALNSGNGPTMPDGKALFHADHGNLAAVAAAPSIATLDAARAAMAFQKDPRSDDFLDLRPDTWLGPVSLAGAVRQVAGTQYSTDETIGMRAPRLVTGLVRDVIDSPRLSGTGWYMFADPAIAPVVEVAFLNGAQRPYLEQQKGFEFEGIRYRVRLDYGVSVVDYRGAYRNAGA